MLTRLMNKITPSLIDRILNPIHKSSLSSNYLSVALENMLAILRGREVRFGIDDRGGLFAIENWRKQQISNRLRGFWLYRDGIQQREDAIFKSYCLENISFKTDDIVVDCGANSGDLFLKISKYIHLNNYYAFEPNPEDYDVLKKNAVGSKNIFHLALGNTNSELKFYTATSTGDSSLVEPDRYDSQIAVRVVRLDSFIVAKKIYFIKLLKIEAEGFEPEVLEGLGSMIQCCQYIALDGGYERGIAREQTFTRCTNYLLSNKFELIDICFPWCRALYKRS